MSEPAQAEFRETKQQLQVISADGDVDEIRQWCAAGRFCWLDLENPDSDTVAKVGEALELHPLAIEDTQEFDQRPKTDVHGEQLLIVYYGAKADADGGIDLVEVHIHVSHRFVLTVHREPLNKLTALHASVGEDPTDDQQTLIYRLLDALTDSLEDELDTVMDTVARQEAMIFTRPRARDRNAMAQLRRSIDTCRRTVATQRQVFERMVQRMEELPAMAHDLRPNYADISDHLWRAVDDMETARESLQNMLDQYSNAVQERLTIVATFFLPLTVVTGFFGMNFNWMVNHIGATWAFWGLGVGGLAVSVIAIYLWLIKTGMYDRPGRR
jgi:magnesium transporter